MILFALLLTAFGGGIGAIFWSLSRHKDQESPGYLIALPYQGSGNQLTCLVRAAHLARLTNRNLLVPNLYPSKHDKTDDARRFDTFLDLSELFRDVRFMDAEKFLEGNYVASCHTYGKWVDFDQLGQPTKRFATEYNIEQLEHHPDWPRPPTINHILSSMEGVKVYCIANLQHVHFGNIDGDFQKLRFLYKDNHRLDIAIHWRRGDFERVCNNKNVTSCFPPISRLKNIVDSNSLNRTIGIFTNDRLELEMNEMGRYFSNLHVFDDMCQMISAGHFIGNRYSTISRIARTIRLSLNRTTEYF